MKGQSTGKTGMAVITTTREKRGHSKRGYHNKVRTGCKTCKMRKIRCDERKPSCIRCSSTGRLCDGYATLHVRPLPKARLPSPQLACNLAITTRAKAPGECHSYQFFLEVTAPSLAGANYSEFWLKEIPRLCIQDPAVWHAIVALSSTHELYVPGGRPQPNPFALQQANAAIRLLVEADASSNWWRALIFTTIFTFVSFLDDDHSQAFVHFSRGCKLLEERFAGEIVDRSDNQAQQLVRQGPDHHRQYHNQPAQSVPVSISALRSHMVGFQLRIRNLSWFSSRASLFSDDRACLSHWTVYEAPRGRQRLADASMATAMGTAVSVADSLFHEMAMSSQEYAKSVYETSLANKISLTRLEVNRDRDGDDKRHRSCFEEIEKAIQAFGHAFEVNARSKTLRVDEKPMKRAFLSLQMLHEMNRFMLGQHPGESGDSKHSSDPLALCTRIVDLAEEVMRLETTVRQKVQYSSVPVANVFNPLFHVAKSGVGRETRQRAIELLRRHRVEGGIWDTALAASLAEAILVREAEASAEYLDAGDPEIFINDFTARGWPAEQEGSMRIHPLSRICNTSLIPQKGRHAALKLRTWREWLTGHPGETIMISW